MATTESINTVSLIAGADFAAADFGKLVELTGTRQCFVANTTTATIGGVIAEVPVLTGQTVPVAILKGIVKVQAGGTILVNHIVVPTASGTVTGVANIAAIPAGSMGVGVALEAAVDGQIFEILAMPLTANS